MNIYLHQKFGLGVGEEHSSHFGFSWGDRFFYDLLIEIYLEE